jgi:hypothetical protein
VKQVLLIARIEGIERATELILAWRGTEPRRQATANERFDTVADPAPGCGQPRRLEADRTEGRPETMRQVRRRIDERAVEIDRRESERPQNTRTAIVAGAASSFSSSASRRSSVSEAPAISSEVQYSPT